MSTTRMPDLFSPQPALTSISPVTVNPNDTIERQIDALDKLIASKPVGSIPITVTSLLAEYILKLNFPHNRRTKPIKIKEYAKDMEEGKWVLNGETIKFADDGYLHDGQNRMKACIRAGVPFTTDIRFGIPASAFSTIDTGKSKTGEDMLTNAGYTNTTKRAGALRWLMNFQSSNIQNRTTYPTQELLNRQKKLDVDGEDIAFNDAISEATLMYKQAKVFVVSSMTALLFLYGKYDPHIINDIIRDADRDVGNMKKLRLILTSVAVSSGNYGGIQDTIRHAYIILTFNAYCNRKRLTANSLKWSSADPYPAFPWV